MIYIIIAPVIYKYLWSITTKYYNRNVLLNHWLIACLITSSHKSMLINIIMHQIENCSSWKYVFEIYNFFVYRTKVIYFILKEPLQIFILQNEYYFHVYIVYFLDFLYSYSRNRILLNLIILVYIKIFYLVLLTLATKHG